MKRDQRYAVDLQQMAALSVTPFVDKTISLTTDVNINLDNYQLDQNEDIDLFRPQFYSHIIDLSSQVKWQLTQTK